MIQDGIIWALAGTFVVAQLWPKLGFGYAKAFKWLATTQQRHSDAVQEAYYAYKQSWEAGLQVEGLPVDEAWMHKYETTEKP